MFHEMSMCVCVCLCVYKDTVVCMYSSECVYVIMRTSFAYTETLACVRESKRTRARVVWRCARKLDYVCWKLCVCVCVCMRMYIVTCMGRTNLICAVKVLSVSPFMRVRALMCVDKQLEYVLWNSCWCV